MRWVAGTLLGAFALAGCGEQEADIDPGRITAIEHTCIVARVEAPDRCGCIAEAVVAKGDHKVDRMIIARMKQDDAALKRELAGLSALEVNHLMMRYEAVGRDAFYHCGKRTSG